MPRMSRRIWWIIGLISATLGWTVGGLFGTFLPRLALAVAATGSAFGLLLGSIRVAVIAAAAASAGAVIFWTTGSRVLSPLIAWPIAALCIGLVGTACLRSVRARIGMTLLSPVLGLLGFSGGVAIIGMAGLAFDNSVVLGEFMIGGAAGFGLVVVDGLLNATRRDRQKSEMPERIG